MAITITLGSISTRTTQKGAKYTVAKGSTIHKADGTERTMTVMTFGPQRDSVAALLRKGKKIVVEAVFDGGVVKILGPQKVRAEKTEQVAEAA